VARCFVTRRLPGSALDRLSEEHEVEIWPDRLPPPPEALRERVHEVEGLLCMLTDRIDADLLAAAPRLRGVANYAVGSDNIDLEAATARGIPVGVTPEVLTEATADLAFALILAACRRLPEAAAAVRAGDWRTWEPGAFLGLELNGATLGVLGAGRIGAAVARRAEGFGMRVLSWSRSSEAALDHVLEQADVVSLHLPLTPETHGLLGASALARMKPTAVLVNTARGPLIDPGALVAALHGGGIAAAALDVTDPEPMPHDHPLLLAPNLLVVPHIGSATHVAREAMAERAVDNLLAALGGESVPYPA
jgi:glyoxylate reductase